MTRASNEAETGRPTAQEEMAKFTGFSTENGETMTPDKPENLNPVTGKPAPAAAAAPKAGEKAPAAAAAKAAPAKLTNDENEAVIAALDTKLGREATEDEITAALAAETAKKSGAAPAKRDPQTRINKAVKAQRAAERTAAAAEARALAAEAALAAGAKAPLTADKKPVNDPTKAPDPKDFEYGELDANYIRALARYETRQELAASKETEQQATLTAEEQANKDKFEEAKAAFEDAGGELYPDFDEVVMQGARDKAWPLSDTLGANLMVSEYGPQIAYELASDTKEAKRVSELAPMRQIAWLGRREAELESAGSGAKVEDESEEGKAAAASGTPAKAAAKVSKAPAPITRVRGQGSASAVPGDTQDFAAFEAAAMARPRK